MALVWRREDRKSAPCPACVLGVTTEGGLKGSPAWQKPETHGNGAKDSGQGRPLQPVPSPAPQAGARRSCATADHGFWAADGEALACRATLNMCKQTFFQLAGFHPAAARKGNRTRQLFELGSVLSACADFCGFLHVHILFLPYVPG